MLSFVDMIEEAKEQGFSVAVFVNFTETLNALSNRLETKCIFDGKTPDKIRDGNVELFQEDKERVISTLDGEQQRFFYHPGFC